MVSENSEKVCPICGVTFPKFGKRKYCSEKCQERASNAIRAVKAGVSRVGSECVCSVCGITFTKTQSRQKHCSEKCRVKKDNKARYDRDPAKNQAANRRWREANRDADLERRRAYYREKNVYYAIRRKARHEANKDAANEYSRIWRAVNYEPYRQEMPWVFLIQGAKGRSRKKNLPFDLTFDWGKQRWTGKCELSGIPFALDNTNSKSKFYSPSIDRIIPSKGYTQENCRFILLSLNTFRMDATDDDMYLVASEFLLKF